MKVTYIDEYNSVIHSAQEDIIPLPGDSVEIQSEVWNVKKRIFRPESGDIIIHISQNSIRVQENTTTEIRHRNTEQHIITLTEQLEAQKADIRRLKEQVGSTRQYINRVIPSLTKPKNDSR